MAAKGSESKNKLFKKLMEVYPNAFWEDEGKILRVPMDEMGERIEIKVTLTAAKNNLGSNAAASAFPEESPVHVNVEPTPAAPIKQEKEVTEEEKENISRLLKSLGL